VTATPNVYTRRWFSTFLEHIDPAIVEREVAFVQRQLAVPPEKQHPVTRLLLDLCCGPGRHTKPLAESGYRVVGLDRDAASLRAAATYAPRAALLRADMRLIPLATAAVDAIICMWQSFGYGDAAENQRVLAEMGRVLCPGGCLIMDLYHRQFYATHEGERVIERDNMRIHERRSMHAGRLRVRLRFESPPSEEAFDWLLYTPGELAAAAAPAGLRLRLACAEFDEQTAASAAHPRMQVVFTAEQTGAA